VRGGTRDRFGLVGDILPQGEQPTTYISIDRNKPHCTGFIIVLRFLGLLLCSKHSICVFTKFISAVNTQFSLVTMHAKKLILNLG